MHWFLDFWSEITPWKLPQYYNHIKVVHAIHEQFDSVYAKFENSSYRTYYEKVYLIITPNEIHTCSINYIVMVWEIPKVIKMLLLICFISNQIILNSSLWWTHKHIHANVPDGEWKPQKVTGKKENC